MASVLLYLGILLGLPLLTYLCAKLAGYGWVMGKWKAFCELYQQRNDRHGDEERP